MKTASPVVFLAKHLGRPEIDNPKADDCLMIAEEVCTSPNVLLPGSRI
jgi:hypothetical protein